MSLRLVTPATDFPISVDEAKAHLRVMGTAEDAYIALLIAAAVAAAEDTTGRFYAPATWELTLDAFPTSEIAIGVGPIDGVTSVSYTDADGATQTLDAAAYQVDARSPRGWVLPVDGWPATMATINAVAVRFTIGGEVMSPAVRQAVLLLIGLWYDTRAAATETTMHEVPQATATLLQRHQRYFV